MQYVSYARLTCFSIRSAGTVTGFLRECRTDTEPTRWFTYSALLFIPMTDFFFRPILWCASRRYAIHREVIVAMSVMCIERTDAGNAIKQWFRWEIHILKKKRHRLHFYIYSPHFSSSTFASFVAFPSLSPTSLPSILSSNCYRLSVKCSSVVGIRRTRQRIESKYTERNSFCYKNRH